jgi:hypothetical protein
MKKIIISGGSDDLIEIEGDIGEEFYAHQDGDFLSFSDGTLLKIIYTEDGCWRISVIQMNAKIIERFEATDSDSEEYSDKLTIEGDFNWVICGQLAKVK